jgi:hypothetical protein
MGTGSNIFKRLADMADLARNVHRTTYWVLTAVSEFISKMAKVIMSWLRCNLVTSYLI